MKLGVLTLADYYPDCQTPHDRLNAIVEEAVLAERLGFDTFWVGEHHFSQYISPNPALLLSAIACRTRRIRLGTGVALSVHHHPLRLAEDYALVDALSGGRLDLVLGRGIYLAGYNGFNQTFSESQTRQEDAALIVRGVWEQTPFSHVGHHTTVRDIDLQPRPVQPRAPLWIGGGRSAASAQFAARAGFHLAMPSVFGPLLQFAGLAEQYRQALVAAGRDPAAYGLSAGQHCYVGATSSAAARAFWEPYYRRYLAFVAGEVPAPLYEGTELEDAAARIRGAPLHLDFARAASSSLLCGDAAEVADRIIAAGKTLGLSHFWAYFDLGGLPVAEVHASMTRFAEQVLPRVRAALPATAGSSGSSAAG